MWQWRSRSLSPCIYRRSLTLRRAIPASSPWLPAPQRGATAMRYEKPMLVYPLHGLDFSELPRFEKTLLQAGLTLDFTLFDAARGARIRRARQQWRAPDASLEAAQQALVAR